MKFELYSCIIWESTYSACTHPARNEEGMERKEKWKMNEIVLTENLI